MRYLKITNDGVLDIPVALNMLGASVKSDRENAIGMFGSGMKYVLAQAARQDIPIIMASGNSIFEIGTRPQEFRGNTFHKVWLRETSSGEAFETPITTDFGKHDWKDSWCVYREFVCNAMDEVNCKITAVNDIRRSTKQTTVYSQ